VKERYGGLVWVFPAGLICRIGYLAHLCGILGTDLSLPGQVEGSKVDKAVGWPCLPDLPYARRLEGFTKPFLEEHGAVTEELLRHYAGPEIPRDAPILLVSDRVAAGLWHLAAEYRTLTALGLDSKVARQQSLRRVELIPDRSVFISLAGWLGATDETEELPPKLQLGAWENLGLGWLRLGLVEEFAPSGEERPLPAAAPMARIDDGRLIAGAWKAVSEISSSFEARFQSAVKAAVANFGPRAQYSGLEAALAFELAKAKPLRLRPGVEHLAHRWVLGNLLELKGDFLAQNGASAVLHRWATESKFCEGVPAPQRERILARWLWMRRYAELELPGTSVEGSP